MRCPFCIFDIGTSDHNLANIQMADHICAVHPNEWSLLSSRISAVQQKEVLLVTVEGVTDDYYFLIRSKPLPDANKIVKACSDTEEALIIEGKIISKKTGKFSGELLRVR